MPASPLQHVEPMLQAGLDTIKANLAAALADQAALAVTLNLPALDLPAPDRDNGYAFGGSEPYMYPLVEVAVPDGALSNWSLYQATADHDATVLIRCQVTDATPELIYRRCLRYGAALIYVVTLPGCFDSGLGSYVISSNDGLRYAYRGWNLEAVEGAPPQRAGGVLLSIRLEGGEQRV